MKAGKIDKRYVKGRSRLKSIQKSSSILVEIVVDTEFDLGWHYRDGYAQVPRDDNFCVTINYATRTCDTLENGQSLIILGKICSCKFNLCLTDLLYISKNWLVNWVQLNFAIRRVLGVRTLKLICANLNFKSICCRDCKRFCQTSENTILNNLFLPTNKLI